MSSTLKKLLIALGVTLLLSIVYFLTIGNSTDEPSAIIIPIVPTTVNTEIARQTEKILSDTKEISTYQLHDSIFEDAKFNSLKDYQIDIADVATGRRNPFLPVY